MIKNKPFGIAVIVVFILLTALFLHFRHLEHQREQELSRLTGEDEQSRIIRNELEDYRLLNRRQQTGVLSVMAGFAVVLVVLIWWDRHSKRKPQ